MIQAILNGVFSLVNSAISMVLTPIDSLFSHLFPDISNYISIVNNFFTSTLPPYVNWFVNLFPPTFKSLFGLYLTFLLSLGVVIISVHTYVYVYRLIQKIKWW